MYKNNICIQCAAHLKDHEGFMCTYLEIRLQGNEQELPCERRQ